MTYGYNIQGNARKYIYNERKNVTMMKYNIQYDLHKSLNILPFYTFKGA